MFDNLIESKEKGSLSIMHLKRFWHKHYLVRKGSLQQQNLPEEWNNDYLLLASLGLGIEQTLKYLYIENPSFEKFEKWILELNNQNLNISKIDTFNSYITNLTIDSNAIVNEKPILSDDDIVFWKENGYIIVRNAISIEDCDTTIDTICNFIQIDRNDKSTWYNSHPAKQGIMVQLFQHPILEKNRNSPRIRKAYEQLWGIKNLFVNTDRVGFNPPETKTWKFPGPRLHWDVSLKTPIPFGLQGILYLSDTAHNQGALSLIPGFHNNIEQWLCSLPENVNPRNVDLSSLGIIPVVANKGDFIIWHHSLPHGSSVNSSNFPRFVQYINYEPFNTFKQDDWI